MDRIQVLKAHLQDADREFVLQYVRSMFKLSPDKLRLIALHMESEMQKGLEKEGGSNLAMIPSYVYKPENTGSPQGVYYALDLGGTNFRVLRMELDDNGKLKSNPRQQAFSIPQRLMAGTATELFDFIATSVAQFSKQFPSTQKSKLGFTFSFPTRQQGIANAELLTWTKGFTTSGMEGKNIAELLQVSLQKVGVSHLNVVAVCNDTVGTLIARYVSDPTAHIGVILGTGSNACYWESTYNMTKLPNVKPGEMVVNIEWGNLGSSPQTSYVLPITQYDAKLDGESPNPGRQLFEKMISGMYLGENARLVLVDVLRNASYHQVLTKKDILTSKVLSNVLSDDSASLPFVQKILKDEVGIQVDSIDERRIIKEVCALVRDRSADLSAAAIAAILHRTRKVQENVSVAIDGSVFEKIPGYPARLRTTLSRVFGVRNANLVLSKDGSGIGAGMIAAVVH